MHSFDHFLLFFDDSRLLMLFDFLTEVTSPM